MVFHVDLRSLETEKTFCAKCVCFDKCKRATCLVLATLCDFASLREVPL
jgi:hypothetical protein